MNIDEDVSVAILVLLDLLSMGTLIGTNFNVDFKYLLIFNSKLRELD